MEIERLKRVLAEIPPRKQFQLRGESVGDDYLLVLAATDFMNQPLKPPRDEEHEAQRIVDRFDNATREDEMLKAFGQLRCYDDLVIYAQQALELQGAELIDRVHNLTILALTVFPDSVGVGWSLKLRRILAELRER